jgi:hypothetical protein
MYVNKFALVFLAVLAGCATLPLGPSVAVMPAPGKPFELFAVEENMCREYAERQTGISPQEASDRSLLTGSVAGTLIGAAAGTAIGALAGNIGAGAIAGAGTGLLLGSASGANAAYGRSWVLQQRYDISYQQCMYAKGNQLPGQPVVSYYPPPPHQPPPRR